MKTLLRLLVVIPSLFISVALNAYGDTSMFPIINKTREIVSYIEDELEYEVVRVELDILSTTKVSYRTLSSNYSYAIIAYGDDRFEDIDVKVYAKYGSEWELVDKDTDVSSVALVTIEPSYTREYKIEITAYKFAAGYEVGHYGLVVCHD